MEKKNISYCRDANYSISRKQIRSFSSAKFIDYTRAKHVKII